MSPLDEMIYISQNLEKILQEQYGAVGRGLGEKAKSVENQLPEDVFRKICKLVAWRNKAVHENIDLANKKIESFRRIAWEICFSLKNDLGEDDSESDSEYEENSYNSEELPSKDSVFWSILGFITFLVIMYPLFILFNVIFDWLGW